MTHATTAHSPTPAGLWARLGAAVYDGLLLLALFFLATAIVDPFLPQDHVPAGAWWFRLYLLLIAFLFNGWFWTHGGQTLGMRAWRLRVVDMAGNALTWRQAAGRFVAAVASWATLLGLLLSIGGRPALQDRLSHTQILRLPKA